MRAPDCPLCGERAHPGLATCLPCAGVGADGVVFARTGAEQRDGSLLARLRTAVARDADTEALGLAAGGHRAIAAVPRNAEAVVTGAFRDQGIPVRVARNGWTGATLPRGVTLSLIAMVLSGTLAGVLVAPSYLALTPLMAILVVTLARMRLATPLVPPRESLSLLGSTDAARSVAQRLASLRPGRARALLARLTGLARALEHRATRLEDEGALENLQTLLSAAGPVAGELDRIARIREVLEDPDLEVAPAQRNALAEVKTAEARLEAALDRAAGVLQRSHRLDRSTLEAARELPRLAREVESRMKAWDDALEAVDRIADGA